MNETDVIYDSNADLNTILVYTEIVGNSKRLQQALQLLQEKNKEIQEQIKIVQELIKD